MRIATVIGNVTLNRHHDSFDSASLKVVLPRTLATDGDEWVDSDEMLVAWDELGCGNGAIVAISEGPEAGRPFKPETKPVDTYVSALLDDVHLDPKTLATLTVKDN